MFNSPANDHKLQVTVKFDSVRHAEVACNSLSPDPELRPDELSRDLSFQDDVLTAEFSAATERVLRMAVNSFMDNLTLITECIQELEADTIKK